jgi:hypothetical protein
MKQRGCGFKKAKKKEQEVDLKKKSEIALTGNRSTI